jgi:putative ABC transport system permease protein
MPEWLTSLLRGIRAAVRADRFDAELDEELEFHIDSRTADNVRNGMSEDDARAAALRSFGRPLRISERARAEHPARRWLDTIRQDASFALRSYMRSPVATAIALLTIAIGIGAVTTVFTIVNLMLLRPMPYPQSEKLTLLFHTWQGDPVVSVDSGIIAHGTYKALQGRIRGLEDVAFGTWDEVNLDIPGGPERIRIGLVSDNFYSTLGVAPQRGAVPQPGVATEMVLSDAAWRSRFGSDAGVVGRALRLSGTSFTVSGIMPPPFNGLADGAEMWLPVGAVRLFPEGATARWGQNVDRASGAVFGRLRDGATLRIVEQQLAAGLAQLPPERAPPGWKIGSGAIRMADARQHPLLRPLLTVLSVAVALVLLIVCANVAGLTLVRVHAREPELAVRRAIGAGRGRIARQLIIEGVVLALLGAVPGIALGYAGAVLLARMRPDLPITFTLLRSTDLLAGAQMRPDGIVIAFALAAVLVVGVCVGVAGYFASGREPLEVTLRRTGARVRAHQQPRANALVIFQVAFATVLVVAAALVIRSVGALTNTPKGYEANGLAVVHLAGDREGALNPRLGAILSAVSALPGVRSAATETCPPFASEMCMMRVAVRTNGVRHEFRDGPRMVIHAVSDEYFRTLGIRIIAGRSFNSSDPDAKRVTRVVVNEAAARSIWPKMDALRQTIGLYEDVSIPDAIVVGVAEDTRYLHLDQPPEPEMYVSQRQEPQQLSQLALFVRTSGSPEALIKPLRAAITGVAPGVATYDAATMRRLVADASSSTRFVARLLAAFAIIAALLSALGVYGMLAWQVSQRRRELGVRAALGAAPLALMKLVSGRAVVLVVAGVLLGILAATGSAPLLERFLFQVRPLDPVSYGSAVLLIVCAGALAGVVPVARAVRVDPSITLRE